MKGEIKAWTEKMESELAEIKTMLKPQKETKAPKGYMLSDEVVKIEINDKGVFANGEKLTEENDVYSILYQNSLLPSVFTGDTKSILMYLTMAAIAVVFIAIMIIIH